MNPAEIIIELRSIAKHYMMGSEGFYALNGIDLDIFAAGFGKNMGP